MAFVDLSKGQSPTDQDDVITGTVGNNAIAAGARNDLITGGGRNDGIDGGPGTDTAFYSGTYANYRISAGRGPGDWTVQDLRNGRPDGSDTLVNVERLHFADKTALLAANKAPTADSFGATINEDNANGLAFRVKVADFLAAHAKDPDGDTVSLASLGKPVDANGVQHGSVGVEADAGGERWVAYTPEPDYNGALHFTYTVQDAIAPSVVSANPALGAADIASKTAQGTVALTVNPIAEGPAFNALDGYLFIGSNWVGGFYLKIAIEGATGPVDLSIVSAPPSGLGHIAYLGPDGATFEFGDWGAASATVVLGVTDQNNGAHDTATIKLVRYDVAAPFSFAGGPGNDAFYLGGTGTADAGGGDDTMVVRAVGPVQLRGGAGNDMMHSLAGGVWMDGGPGQDSYQGGAFAGRIPSIYDTFVLRAGEAQGDRILNFDGVAGGEGDKLRLEGYGLGVTLTPGSSSGSQATWVITYGGGTESFVLLDAAAFDPTADVVWA